MKKRATRKPASRKPPRKPTAAAKKATAKKAGPRQTTTTSKGSGRYTPPEIQGTGWPAFRYPPQ